MNSRANYSVLSEILRKCKGFRAVFSESKLFSNLKRALGQRPKGKIGLEYSFKTSESSKA